jgi:Glycosyl hydrolases family 39
MGVASILIAALHSAQWTTVPAGRQVAELGRRTGLRALRSSSVDGRSRSGLRHIHNLFTNLDDTSAITRRRLLAAGAGAVVGGGPEPSWADKKTAAPRLSVTESATAEGAPLRAAEFAMVGVFDVDWLLEPRFTRLLDYFAASPGAFRAVRCFGALNSGEREDTFPRLPGGVWLQRDERPDFSTTLRALAALVSRDLVPFVALTFFPPAVSSSPTTPPADFGAWRTLVRGFLDAVVARFGAGEVARWWFEVWNEPNMPPFWGGSFDRYLELYRATSDTVEQSGHEVRLGGPALAYIPGEGPALMARFLRFLARAYGPVRVYLLSPQGHLG